MWRKKINRELYFSWSTSPIFVLIVKVSEKMFAYQSNVLHFSSFVKKSCFWSSKFWRIIHLPIFLAILSRKNNLNKEKKIRFYFVHNTSVAKNKLLFFCILVVKPMKRCAFTKRWWTYYYHLPETNITLLEILLKIILWKPWKHTWSGFD